MIWNLIVILAIGGGIVVLIPSRAFYDLELPVLFTLGSTLLVVS